MNPPRVLTVAGSDSGGGAGIQADLKTIFARGAHGMSAVAAVTVQNSVGVQGFHEVPPEILVAQIEAVVTDIGVDATKTGMLASARLIEAAADAVERFELDPLIVDPVAASKHGDPLLRRDALDALRHRLLPLATIATPNLGEVRLLTGVEVRGRDDLETAARALHALGPRWVLVKGGPLPDGEEAVDVLWDGRTGVEITGPRINTPHTHGGGDTLSAAIAAGLARGLGMVEAVRAAKEFTAGAIAAGYRLGRGIGPVDPGWQIERLRLGATSMDGLAIRPGVAAIIRDRDGNVLLHRRRVGQGWAPLSGTVEPGEEMLDALRREVREETGLALTAARLVAVYSRPDYQVVDYPDGRRVHFVTCLFDGTANGELRGSDEGEAWGWFAPTALPEPLLPYARVWVRDALRESSEVMLC
jgi:hydroxymethylpyrimidine/phosphomethylpyrimidine kinase